MKHDETNFKTMKDLFKVFNKKFENLTRGNLSTVIRKLLKEQVITNQSIKNYRFTEHDLNVISDYFRKRNYHLDPSYRQENFFTLDEASTLLVNTPYTKSMILRLSNDRNSLGVTLYKNSLLVPKDLVLELAQSGDISNYIRGAELARQLNVGKHVVERRANSGYFKDIKQISGIYYISKIEAEKWIEDLMSPNQNYSNEDAIREMKNYLNQLLKRIANHSHVLFETWIISKLVKSHGRSTTLKHISVFGIELYEFLLKNLPKDVEIYNLDQNLVESLVTLEMNVRLRKEFVIFYNYSLASTPASPDKQQLRIERPVRDKKMKYSQIQTKTIYHPELYRKYYVHVQDIENHTDKGLKTRTYANMWLYVIMHLTNVWRANDIIFQMPRISIENVGIHDFQWFESNKINITQAQIIANEVYIHFRNKLANKNLNILRFYLDPTLLLSFSTAIVICELHSRFPSNSIRVHREELLGTFISGRRGIYLFRSGLHTHKCFFGDNEDLKNFSSLAMNRSTMVYFFHNTIEGQNGDTDVALELTKMVRSHSDSNTTAIYVESSNQDGAINRVSLNLFSRGHFGWLYNYMINLMMSSKTKSLEERTEQIIKMKKEFSPSNIENWSEYFINSKKHNDPAIVQLSKLSEEHLINLLSNIFKGKMPSKHKEGQCLTYPTCNNSHYSTCFGCSFFIPQEFILLEAIDALKNRVPKLRNSTLEAVIIRESKFINSILRLISEAVRYLGNEKLYSFISRQELNEMMHSISDKLLITEG